MNAMMNNMQLCGAAAGRCDRLPASPRKAAAAKPAARRYDAPRLGLGVAAVVAGTVMAALAAATLVVARAGMPEPLPIVELPRVVIQAKRLAPGVCPVPVEAGTDACPIPTDATNATAIESTTFRRTPL